MKKMFSSDIIIDVKDVTPAQRHPMCCIYKVPNKLREVKEEAYTPKLISIGPVHHNKKELENMERLKLKYFKEFFCQTTCKGQKEFADIIENREETIRHCYAEEISSSLPEKKDFLQMILLDSIFIIELFLRTAAREGYEKDDYILSKPWLEEGIKHDLILLENQLPFFILDDLYRHIGRFPGFHNSFLNLAWNYFFPNDNCKNIPKKKEVKHFTDLQRYFFYSPKLESSDRIIEHLYSATKLDTAGLNFKKWEKKPPEEDRRLLDIQIKKPDPLEIFPCFNCSWLLHCLPCLKCFWCLKRMQTSLVIPPFVINHGTEHIFRNIMALEQCHYPKEAYICNYIVLLDFLINTRDDAELLVDKKIIVHSLGSNKEVAKMVNKLGKEIVEKNSCYLKVAENLNEHYENWWNKNIASLKTVYFRDIWRGTATFVGIIVLLVTIGNFLRPFVYHK
ncbi:UPF0481 protein At3g47200-like isoform X2 [Quercus robur]|uniref:UPF0481 protein At3g47200-like isoform X2 n=1 Tax=Quercus robur TaxID=38942 RepID=UPI002161A8EA|nr:UPF0481 protein At3g47200-like isoform X2 [Quercus robur]XP_050282432.1 UPF0481 protein At3g47200-like isoform X2 [Quercus robur]XP_050282433.1 UPF0481 protein At3g47200-like isoform X2 [Quercus robur]XP_050282434.1 UPF0481 protein At3g47200-like isoform X2 [Quercus robur]